MMRFPRFILSLSLVLASSSALADKHACVQASEAGQRLRADGKLLEAQQRFHACADSSCPSVVASACSSWISEVDRSTPTLVVAAHNDSGGDVLDATCRIDGNVVANHLDGRAIPVNPGAHTIEIERNGQKKSIEVLAREGDKERLVSIGLGAPPSDNPPPPPPPPPPPTGRPSSTIAVVALVGTLVSGVAFGVLAGVSHIQYRNLQEGCGLSSAGCDSVEVAPVQRLQIAADVMLGLTIAAAITTTVLFLVSASSHASHAAFTPSDLVVRF